MKYNFFYVDEYFNEYRFEEDELSVQKTEINDNITKFSFVVKNGVQPRKIIPVFQIAELENMNFYMIPCVNYNGNEWGNGQEPKGMFRNGRAWIFPSDRVGLPGCSIAENENRCMSVFSANSGYSKNSSASIFTVGEKTVQRIYFSHIEYPNSYLCKYEYGEPVINALQIEENQNIVFECFVYDYKKSSEEVFYGYKKLFDFVNSDAYFNEVEFKYDLLTVKKMNEIFLRSLTEKTADGWLSNMGILPDGEHKLGNKNCKWEYRKTGKYEIGWCGQNISVAETYLRLYIENHDKTDLEKGLGILDTWLKRRYASGLYGVNYETVFDGMEKIDTCNEGWFIYKLTVCCRLIKGLNLPVTAYENALKSTCDFFVENYKIGQIPQILYSDGSICVQEGCAGAMTMLGLIFAYEYFNDEQYLNRAKSAFDFYYNNYLSKSVAGGGALDTYCIDKESAGPILRSAIKLFQITNDYDYLVFAENIAHYLMTWCFYSDIDFDKDCDCGKLRLRTTGGTVVSTAHQHIDCWGSYYVTDFLVLYSITNNTAYYKHARTLWGFVLQYVSDGKLNLHDMIRPIGAQNEAILQCGWHFGDERKGQLNDWMVTWVKTFQLDVIYALQNKSEINF